MAERKTIYIDDAAMKIIEKAPGESLARKVNGVVIRYGEIIEIRPDLAISSSDAIKEKLKDALTK
jgi:hypothetical protein